MPGIRKPSPKKESKKGRANSTNLGIEPSLAEALLQSAGSGIYIVQDDKFAYINPYFTELSGYVLQELDGKSSLDLVYPGDRDSVKKQAITRLKEGRSEHPYEYRFIKKTGEIMWVLERITSIEYMGRRAALGSFMDINQRKEMEKALARSEGRHRAILDQMNDACFEVDLTGQFTYTNSFMCRSMQYKQNELIGRDYNVIIPESDAEAVARVFRRVSETGHPDTAFSHRVRRKDGLEFFVESSVALIRDDNGKPTGYICVGRDVSESKRLEMALVRSEERFRNILERMQDAYYEVDLAGNFTFVNDATSRHLYYSREELIGNSYRMIMLEGEAERVFNAFHEVFITGEPNPGFAHRVTRKDGVSGYAESSVALLKDDHGKPIGFSSVSRDITERKQLEKKLLEEKDFSSSVIDSMPGIFYALDEKGDFVRWNKNEEKVLGYSAGELAGMNALDTIAEGDRPLIADAISEVFSKGSKQVEAVLSTKDNRQLLYLLTGALAPVGDKSYLVGMGIDISERKNLEEALQRSEERFRTILENMQDSYFEVDLKGNYTFVNLSASSRLGYLREELIGQNYRFTTPSEDLANTQAAFSEVYSSGIANRSFLHKSVCKDGKVIFVESSIGLLKDEKGQAIGFNSVSRDVTQRMEFEQRLADMATHDFLTGLPNRLLLNDRLHMALAQAQRNKNKLAILTLDLDRFKTVNDALGHHVGDELLKAVGQRLTGIIRSGDTIARMGGDEFMLLMPELHQSDNVSGIVSKIIESFDAPFIIEGHRLSISVSIGIAIYPDDGVEMEALMRKSDSAMYDIKRHGPSQTG